MITFSAGLAFIICAYLLGMLTENGLGTRFTPARIQANDRCIAGLFGIAGVVVAWMIVAL